MTHHLLAIWDGAGLVTAELSVGRRLIERGHRVTVLADPTIEAEAIAIGAAFRPWVEAPHRTSRDPMDDPRRSWTTDSLMEVFPQFRDEFVVEPVLRFAADAMAAHQADPVDVVVADSFLLGVFLMCEALGLPGAALVPNVYTIPVEGRVPFGTAWSPPEAPAEHLLQARTNRLLARMWDKRLPELNAMRATLGLDRLSHFWEQLDRLDRVLVLTPAAFDFAGPLPPNVRYVGAQLDDPVWCEPWKPPAGDEPLVLVSMSSAHQGQASLLRRILEALSSLPVRVVLTSGPTVDPAVLSSGSDDPRRQVVRSAPHQEVLRHASVAITHGGHGTLLKALGAGKPVLCIPMGADQPDNAARLVAHGAGLSLSPDAAVDEIAHATVRLLDEPDFRVGADRMAVAVRADAQRGAVVCELESMAWVTA